MAIGHPEDPKDIAREAAGSQRESRVLNQEQNIDRKVDFTRRTTMAGGKMDEAKGRVKEAAGALTGDKGLKREGKLDQAVGKTKQTVDKVIDKTKDAVKKADR
jgi:uncharacterized protein YjbJ (UPF0337 family)